MLDTLFLTLFSAFSMKVAFCAGINRVSEVVYISHVIDW